MFTEWGKNSFDQPVLLKFELETIPNLFQEHELAAYGIDHDAIKSWFVPRYLDICNVLNSQKDPNDQLDCTKTSGCGFDDDCSLDETCVTDPNSERNFRCGNAFLFLYQLCKHYLIQNVIFGRSKVYG